MKKITLFSTAVLTIIVLSGCGSKLPQMTYDQEEKIVEYAASAVMQNMENYNSRLVDLSLYDSKQTVQEETEPSGMDPVTDTDIIDSSSEENNITLEELLGLADVSIQYKDYQVLESYPNEETDNPVFVLDASEGKKLLVLHFILQNLSEDSSKVNIYEVLPRFIVSINNDKSANALSTMLLDDISTYAGEIPASGKIDLVLLTEFEEESISDITSIDLKTSTSGGTTTISLE